MAIDVGAACIDRGIQFLGNNTIIALDNPANAPGTIDSVCIYVQSNMTGIEFASFNGSNPFSTNGDTNGSNLSCTVAESPKTFNAPANFTAFNINSDEFMGFYCSAGNIERDLDGGAGLWYLSGDNIPCTDATFTFFSGDIMSLYATGVEAGVGAPLFLPEQLDFSPFSGIY